MTQKKIFVGSYDANGFPTHAPLEPGDILITADGKQILVGDEEGKLPNDQVPAVATTEVYIAENLGDMLSVVAQIGDIVIRNDLHKTFILKDEPSNIETNWAEMPVPVLTVFGRIGNITAVSGDYSVEQIAGLIDALANKSNTDHTHVESDVTGLTDNLAGKAPIVHTHTESEVTGLTDSLAGKAPNIHTHLKEDVTDFEHTHLESHITGLTDILAGKAPTEHTHLESDITGLTDSLAGKAPTVHTHLKEDVTDFEHTHAENEVIGLTDSLSALIPLTQKNQPLGVPSLDANGKVPSSQLPPIAITDTHVVNSETAMLALIVEVGDIAIRPDINKSFILKAPDGTNISNWEELLSPTAEVSSVFGRIGDITAQPGDYSTSDITGLTDSLAGKAPIVHAHVESDITGLTDSLAEKAPTVHTHTESDVTGLTDSLAGKAPTVHTHLESEVNGLTNALLSLTPVPTRELYVDVNRSGSYTEDGTHLKPFKTIQAAINKIIENNDDNLNPYNIFIQTGKYYENIVLESLNLHRIKLTGVGIVQIRPTSGESLKSTINNSNLKMFHLKGITFLAPVVITGSNGSTAFDDVIWEDCNFVPGDGAQKGTLTVTCINNLTNRRALAYNCNFVYNNVNYGLIESCSIGSGSLLQVSMDSSADLPSWGASGGVIINGSVLTGTPSFSLAGSTQSYQLQMNFSRIATNTSTVTIPSGMTLTANSSFLRGTWTNNGTLYLRNSFIEVISGTLPNLQQPASQIGNDSDVIGPTVKDAINTVNSESLKKNTISGTFTTNDGKTITVVDGQITEIITE